MPNFKKAKSSNWIESDQFGDFASSNVAENGFELPKNTEAGSRKRGRARENNNTLKNPPTKSLSVPHLQDEDAGNLGPPPLPGSSSHSDLWIHKHQPASVEDLAVNNKKVEEVRRWLLDSAGKGGMLLLCGPAGAGKTATLSCVARSLGLGVTEWVNPVEQVHYTSDRMVEDEDRDDFRDTVSYVSKSRQFREWLRGAKYSSVNEGGSGKKIILIEDFPSNKLEDLHEALESFIGSKSRIPLVFVISESATAKQSGSVKQIFPPQVVEKLRMSKINFNPVTTSNMVKTLTKIAVIESQKGVRKFKVPDKSTLENLAESVGGDLRAGVNALQFSCLNDTGDLKKAFESVCKTASSKPSKSGVAKKSSQSTVSELSRIGGKDQGLVMFHALGKILYCKREEQLEAAQLPDQLQLHARKTLKSNPDEVVDRSTLSADAFNCFLHQNFPPFYTRVEDAARLAEYLSTADLLMSEWAGGGKVALSEYGGLVGARATAHCNSAPATNLGMRRLTKPEHYAAVRTVRQRQYDLQNIFHATPGRELVTCSLPLISRIRPRGVAAHRLATITELATFHGIKQAVSRPGVGIDQDDIFDESQDVGDVATRNKEEGEEADVVQEDDEELIIEDFDD